MVEGSRQEHEVEGPPLLCFHSTSSLTLSASSPSYVVPSCAHSECARVRLCSSSFGKQSKPRSVWMAPLPLISATFHETWFSTLCIYFLYKKCI